MYFPYLLPLQSGKSLKVQGYLTPGVGGGGWVGVGVGEDNH